MEEIIEGQRRFLKTWIITILSVIVVVSVITGLNYLYTLSNPGGKDALVHWMGTRLFLGRGMDPYGNEATAQYQIAARELCEYSGEEELRFASPLYIIVFYVPFLFMSDFNLVRAIWMTLLEGGILLQLFISFRLVKWKPGRTSFIALVCFIFLTQYSLQTIKDCDIVVLVALCISGGIWALKQEGDELAGVLFALASLKIHLVLIFYLVILYWAFRQKRYKVIGWLLSTIFILSLSTALLMPDWIVAETRSAATVLLSYPLGYLGQYLSVPLPGMGMRIGWVITGILLLLLVVEWIIISWSQSRNLLWVIYFTLVVSQWVGIRIDSGNFILLVPVFVFVFSLWQERWHKYGVLFTVVSLFGILGTGWSLYLSQMDDLSRQRIFTLIPEPVFLLVTLYWVKWWAEHKERLWFDVVSSQPGLRNHPGI